MSTKANGSQYLKAYCGHLGPDWRLQLAQQFLPRYPRRPPWGWTDLWIENLLRYLAATGDTVALEQAQVAHPAIHAAQQLQANREVTSQLKLAVLGNLTPDEIQQRLGIEPETLEAWEHVHFDVRGSSEATGWLATHVVGRERKAGDGLLASQMRLVIGAGPIAAQALLDGNAELPLDEADRLFQRKWKLAAKFDHAAEMAVDAPGAALRFVELTHRMQQEEHRLKLAGRRLEQRCAEARDRHERANRRLALQEQRIEARLAQRREREERRQRAAAERHDRQQRATSEQGVRETLVGGRLDACSGLARLAWAKAPAATTAEEAPAHDSHRATMMTSMSTVVTEHERAEPVAAEPDFELIGVACEADFLVGAE